MATRGWTSSAAMIPRGQPAAIGIPHDTGITHSGDTRQSP
jgi:hypothetical protein